MDSLTTSRLLLRPWRASDRQAFASINADPVVMEHFPSILTTEQTEAMVDRIEAHIKQHGFGLWAVEIPNVTEFAGFIGLCYPRFTARFTPYVEIGWRLGLSYWGQGYATEGARAALQYGFDVLGFKEILSFTSPDNSRSRKVMEKLGMTSDPADEFDHPLVPEGHPLRRHVLYRITAS
jgi:RimJ/RimL family protein N-acetyltransferase